jgi:DNA-binding CsgD family transcriptional regulator
LTDREIEVLQKIAMGKTRREVSKDLNISEHTVADHIKRIYKKLGIASVVS